MNGIRFNKCQHLSDGSEVQVAGVIDTQDPTLGKLRTSACRHCYEAFQTRRGPSSVSGVVREFFDLPSGRYPSQRGVYFPLRGPWVVLSQHDYRAQRMMRQGCSWSELIAHAGSISEDLDLRLGQVAYQRTLDARVEIAAYYYDTTD